MNGALLAAGVLGAALLAGPLVPTVDYTAAPHAAAAPAETVVSVAGHRYAYAWQDGSPILVGLDGMTAR